MARGWTDGYYTVERILACRREADGTFRWRVRWEGYTAQDDTWEPYENLADLGPKCLAHMEDLRKSVSQDADSGSSSGSASDDANDGSLGDSEQSDSDSSEDEIFAPQSKKARLQSSIERRLRTPNSQPTRRLRAHANHSVDDHDPRPRGRLAPQVDSDGGEDRQKSSFGTESAAGTGPVSAGPMALTTLPPYVWSALDSVSPPKRRVIPRPKPAPRRGPGIGMGGISMSAPTRSRFGPTPEYAEWESGILSANRFGPTPAWASGIVPATRLINEYSSESEVEEEASSSEPGNEERSESSQKDASGEQAGSLKAQQTEAKVIHLTRVPVNEGKLEFRVVIEYESGERQVVTVEEASERCMDSFLSYLLARIHPACA